MTVAAASERRTAAARTATPSIRTAIGILVTRFPRIDETNILREINELERQGQPVVLIPLVRGGSLVVHEEAKPWIERALYMPLISGKILLANIKRLFRQPALYLRLLLELLAGTAIKPGVMLRTLALFPKSVYLAELLPRLGVRHIHAHFAVHPSTMAYIISSFSNVTYSFTAHGPDVFVHRLLLREKIRRAKFVRAVSTFVKAYVTGLHPVVSTRKIEVVHVGVNPEVYEEAAAVATRPRTGIRILSVASLNGTKGFGFLVDACARLIKEGVDLDCVIIGDGPNRRRIAERIAQHGLSDRIRMTGALPQHEVARHVAECDIFVLPSIVAYNGQMDGVPIALMEAMAAGRPVIASPISGITELVEHGKSGILVDATHSERIAESLRMLIGNPDLRDRMGRAGQDRVRSEFDVRNTTEAMIRLFERQPGASRTVSQTLSSLDWQKLNPCALGLRRVRERDDSFIAEVTITDGVAKRDVVVKQQRIAGDPAEAHQRAQREFDVLTRLRASMDVSMPDGGVIYSVPRVLVFDRRQSAIVMDRLTGRPLDSLVDTSAIPAVIPVRRAGTWLRRMQRATTARQDGKAILARRLEEAHADLDLAAAADRSLRRNCQRVLDTLSMLGARVAERPMPVVGSHGDYRPSNVFVARQRVDAIDFDEYREGLPLEDVAYFLVSLRLRAGKLITGHGPGRLEASFLAGYTEGDELDADALRLFTIMKALQILARDHEAPGGVRAFLQRRALRLIVLSAL